MDPDELADRRPLADDVDVDAIGPAEAVRSLGVQADADAVRPECRPVRVRGLDHVEPRVATLGVEVVVGGEGVHARLLQPLLRP
jgi:hypothetical protein